MSFLEDLDQNGAGTYNLFQLFKVPLNCKLSNEIFFLHINSKIPQFVIQTKRK